MEKLNIVHKGIVIYESKYGATEQYAQWLGEELKLPVITTTDLKTNQLKDFDFLLLGTPVYIGRFRIKRWLKKNIKSIIGRKLFLFIVNATSPREEVKRERFVLDNIPAEVRHLFDRYFLPGRLIHRKLSLTDRFLVKMGEIIEKDPDKKRAMHSDLNEVKKENLIPLINAVNDFTFIAAPLQSAEE